MNFKNKALQKFISSLLIVAVLLPAASFALFPKPQKAEAWGPVVDVVDAVPTWVKIIKDTLKQLLEQFLKGLARRLLDMMTKSTIDWINSGFHGAPLFVENPDTFFMDIIHAQLDGFVNEIAFDPIKFPFGKDYALQVVDKATSTFQQNSAYSLSQMNLSTAEVLRQRDDFAAGGWGGLMMNTQKLQNNFLGYQIMAEQELNRRLTGLYSEPQKTKDKLSQGSGFLSQEMCITNPNWDPKLATQTPQPMQYNPPASPPATPAEVAAYDKLYDLNTTGSAADFKAYYGCPEGPRNTTPGSVAAGQIVKGLTSKQNQGELAAALGNSLAALFDALIGKLFTEGLSKLKGAIAPTAQPKQTDYNFYGLTDTKDVLGNPAANPESTINIQPTINAGGLLTNTDISIYVDGSFTLTGGNMFASGNHTVTATVPPGYTVTIGGDCSAAGDVFVDVGQVKNCTVVFDPIPGYSNTLPQLTVTEVINGGTYAQNSIPVDVNSAPTSLGIQYSYAVGPTTVTAQIPIGSGYTMTIGGDCSANGVVDLSIGDVKNCVVTFDSASTTNTTGQLTVQLYINNNAQLGGTLVPANVQIVVGGTIVRPGIPVAIDPGTYTIIPNTLNGTYSGNYDLSFAGACSSTGDITIASVSSAVTCVVIYNEI